MADRRTAMFTLRLTPDERAVLRRCALARRTTSAKLLRAVIQLVRDDDFDLLRELLRNT